MSDRILGFIVTMLALGFFASASQLETPFFTDPVGPKTFPYIIAVVAFIAGCTMIALPDPEPHWPGLVMLGRILSAVIVLVLYAYALKPLGFLLPTALAAGALSYQIVPRRWRAAITGVGLSFGLFIIFKFGLGLGLFALPRWVWS